MAQVTMNESQGQAPKGNEVLCLDLLDHCAWGSEAPLCETVLMRDPQGEEPRSPANNQHPLASRVSEMSWKLTFDCNIIRDLESKSPS